MRQSNWKCKRAKRNLWHKKIKSQKKKEELREKTAGLREGGSE
jgi:hypothetical protein